MFDGKAKVGIHTESKTGEGDKNNLKSENNDQNNQEQAVRGNSFKNVQLFVEFLGVNKVEERHHNESVENEGKVP